jgi:hypothetical protein
MSSPNKLSLAKIVQKLPLTNINRSFSRRGVYQRLNVAKNSDLVNVSWPSQEKFYEILQISYNRI